MNLVAATPLKVTPVVPFSPLAKNLRRLSGLARELNERDERPEAHIEAEHRAVAIWTTILCRAVEEPARGLEQVRDWRLAHAADEAVQLLIAPRRVDPEDRPVTVGSACERNSIEPAVRALGQPAAGKAGGWPVFDLFGQRKAKVSRPPHP